MKENNKTCIVCSKAYSYCSRCGQYSSQPKWRNIYCSDNCRKIFHIASDFNANLIDEKEAKKLLAECDLSNKKDLKGNISSLIDSIMATKPTRGQRAKVKRIADETTQSDVTAENTQITKEQI